MIMAPLSGYTDWAYRRSMRLCGCKYAFTEMIDISSLTYRHPRSLAMLERREDEEAVMTAIHQLPASFRETIMLYYYQGYGINEIAEMLDLPEGTISSRLSRARKKLEEILKESEVNP